MMETVLLKSVVALGRCNFCHGTIPDYAEQSEKVPIGICVAEIKTYDILGYAEFSSDGSRMPK